MEKETLENITQRLDQLEKNRCGDKSETVFSC